MLANERTDKNKKIETTSVMMEVIKALGSMTKEGTVS